MDYAKTRNEVESRKMELLDRQREISARRKELDDEDVQINRELNALDQIVDGLDSLNSEIPPDFEPTGFTDSIRKILSESPVPLIPTQIRDLLKARGISGSSPKNLLINVHKVLQRIDPELDRTTMPDGKTAYRHKSAIRAANLAPVVDLMAALKKSLAEMDKKKEDRKTVAK